MTTTTTTTYLEIEFDCIEIEFDATITRRLGRPCRPDGRQGSGFESGVGGAAA